MSETLQNKTRYSDQELKEFEALISTKLDVARAELIAYKNTLSGASVGGVSKMKSVDDGNASVERERMTQLAGRQSKHIQNLERALVRIKNGTYGICSVSGNLISKERLMAVPHTTQSIAVKKARL